MIEKNAFRALTPAHLGWMDEPHDPDFECELGWVNLVTKNGTGAVYTQGRNTGSQLVALESGMTRLEVLTAMRAVPTFGMSQKLLADSGGLVNTYDTEEETQMLARVLFLTGLPLRPGSSISDVITVLEPLCPCLMWTKALPVEEKGVPKGTYDRYLMALRDGLMIEVRFRQDKLDGITVTDLELMILNDELESVGKARKAVIRSENLASLETDAVPFALKWGFCPAPDKVEWTRGITVPPPKAEQPKAEPEQFELDLPEGLAGMDVADLDIEEMSEAMNAAGRRQLQEQMDKRYGSLQGLLEQAADAELLSECINRWNES